MNNQIFFALLSAIAMCSTQAFAQSDEFVIPYVSDWKYYAQVNKPDKVWTRLDFDDSAWKQGKAGFGYGDSDDNTVLKDMRGSYDSVYIRKKFELSTIPKKLYLYIHYDDAFVAYVNGKKVKARGKRGKGHEAKGFEIYSLKRKYFVKGTNVLAIQGINTSVTSSDFSLWPALATSDKLAAAAQ